MSQIATQDSETLIWEGVSSWRGLWVDKGFTIVSIVNAFTQCSKTMTQTFTKQPSHLPWANLWKQTQTNTLALKYPPKCRFRCQWRSRSVLRFTVTILLLLPLPSTVPSHSYNTKCRQLRVLNVNITNFAAKLIPPPTTTRHHRGITTFGELQIRVAK